MGLVIICYTTGVNSIVLCYFWAITDYMIIWALISELLPLFWSVNHLLLCYRALWSLFKLLLLDSYALEIHADILLNFLCLLIRQCWSILFVAILIARQRSVTLIDMEGKEYVKFDFHLWWIVDVKEMIF